MSWVNRANLVSLCKERMAIQIPASVIPGPDQRGDTEWERVLYGSGDFLRRASF